jgi:hypothetical protein
MPPSIGSASSLVAGADEFWMKTLQLQRGNFAKAIQKGVKIALGTDAGGFDWRKINQAREFEYYVQYGMTPMQAIRAGTSVAAELLGWSESAGTVEAGKWADLGSQRQPPKTCGTAEVKFVMKVCHLQERTEKVSLALRHDVSSYQPRVLSFDSFRMGMSGGIFHRAKKS